MKREVTITDVAQKANVSVTTVSRILNDRPDVSEETRRHVQRVIEDLGYMPRLQAQSLAAGKSHTLALLFPLEHAQATQLELSFVVGAARAAEDEDFYFNLVTAPVSEPSLERLYRSAQVDGVIIMQVGVDDWRVDYLRANELDFVMIGRTQDSTSLSYVDFDFQNAVLRMFELLYQKGHRTIAFITRPEETRLMGIGSSVRLYEGFKSAINRFDLPVLLKETNLSPAATEAAFRELVEEAPDISAVVTTHGTSTAGVLRAAEHLGINVPEDLSVVSIATQKIAETVIPSLTTVDFPSFEMGYEATRILVERVLGRHNGVPTQKLFAPTVCMRESVIEIETKGDRSP